MSAPARLTWLIVTWYSASIVACVTCKAIMIATASPFTLSTLQFAIAALGARQLNSIPLPLEATEFWHVLAVAISYACGFLLTNAAIALAAPSFVETFKAAEPLSTVWLAALFLGEREMASTLATLFPIVIGVAMASNSSSAFSTVGMVLSLLSNLSFSMRAVLTKALKRSYPAALASRSDVCLFYHVSRFGFLLLLPFAVCFDAHRLFSGTFAMRMSADAVNATSKGGISIGEGAAATREEEDETQDWKNRLCLLLLILANVCAHALYNGVSFAVLARVSVSTHAVLNIIRRVVIIAVASALFGTPLSVTNWLGIMLAALGVVAFGILKNRMGGTHASREGLLLPISESVARTV